MDSFYFPTLFAEGIEWPVPLRIGIIQPVMGCLVNRRDDRYIYAGFAARVRMNARLTMVPSAAAGRYWMGGGYDLGGPLQFKTGMVMEWCSGGTVVAGISFDHISNANIYRSNPGINMLSARLRISISGPH